MIEHYKIEIAEIISKHLSLPIIEYEPLIQDLAEYVDEEVFQTACDASGD